MTSATVVGGEIVMPGATITVPLDEAAGLVRRGKAVRAGARLGNAAQEPAAAGDNRLSEGTTPAGRKKSTRA